MYIVVESWLNDSATNKTRGQILSIYLIITMAGMGISQMLAGLDDDAVTFILGGISRCVYCGCAYPSISVGKSSDFSVTETTNLRRLFQISPLAFVGMALQGVVAMMFGMGSVYGSKNWPLGASIGYSLAVSFCGLIGSIPVGRLSDLIDRRFVILIVTFLSGAIACAGLFVALSNFVILLLIMGLYGGLSLTLYSLCIAHANDYLSPLQTGLAQRLPLSVVNGAGSVIGSPLVALVMVIRDMGYYGTISDTFCLGVFVLLRMTRRGLCPMKRKAHLWLCQMLRDPLVEIALNQKPAAGG